MNGYFLPLDALNDLQIKSLDRLIARAKHAHYTDVDMRINGQNERFEADWIKHLRAAPSAEQKVGLPTEDDSLYLRNEIALINEAAEYLENAAVVAANHSGPSHDPENKRQWALAQAVRRIAAALPAPPTSPRG